MLASLSSRELSEWMAFYSIENEERLEEETKRKAEAELAAARKNRPPRPPVRAVRVRS